MLIKHCAAFVWGGGYEAIRRGFVYTLCYTNSLTQQQCHFIVDRQHATNTYSQ